MSATNRAASPNPVAANPSLVAEDADSTRSGADRQTLFSAISHYPTFRRLWYSAVGASAAQWMQTTALGWLALELTDSKSFVGLVAFMAGVPFLLVSVPAGAILDRFDRRRILMTSQIVAAAVACVVAVDVISGFVQPWHLLVAAFCNGALQAVLTPTQQALVPRLVPRDALTNAVGLLSAGQNMTRIVGPSLAGAVIGFIGTGETFIIQAAVLLTALYLIATSRFPVVQRPAKIVGNRSMFDGLQLVFRRDDLRGLLLLTSIPSLLVFPYMSFMPVFARDVLKIGPTGLGLLMGSSGLGAVIGSLMVASNRWRRSSGWWLLGMTIVYGLVVAGMTFSRTVFLTCPLLALGSLIGSNFMGASNALVQHRVSDDVRGRVMGAYTLTFGLMPLGAMPMGIIADHIGAPGAIAISAISCSALTIALGTLSRTLREL